MDRKEGKKRVLIVDDEPDLVETVKFSLESENIECLEAFDGQEGLLKAKEENPDLIVLDIMLPKVNGYKVCRLLKFDRQYKKIPIIMLTARTHEKDINLGYETGANEYVTKPFQMENLINLIKKYLNEPEN